MDNALHPLVAPSVQLRDLVAGLYDGKVSGTVTGLTLDSRRVEPGWLYAALPGGSVHGARFAAQAVEAGAVAVLTDAEGARLAGEVPVPVIVAARVREAMAVIASRLFGQPARDLTTLAVTGTNGKTTTVALLQAGLAAHGCLTGTIGTIGFRLGDEELRGDRTTVTTPESPDLQALLAVMRERGAGAVALEVSSHALSLDRVAGIGFDAAGFLNLGRDHLDFHDTVEDYFEAKARLFEPGRAAANIVWVDDPAGQEIARRIRGHARLVTVGTGEDVDYRLSHYRPVAPLGGQAQLCRGDECHTMRLAIPGLYNMIDAAVAFAMLEAVGVPAAAILRGLAVAQVPGRMQQVTLGSAAPVVVVDFAHTPQAVAAALDSLTGIGPVTAVVGCGGDRDPKKRPEMGRAAAQHSALVVITDDNPRTEDPAAIRQQALAGALAVPGVEVIEVAGRRTAIEEALRRTASDGVVAILGKGHERGQILAEGIVGFDDVEEATLAWRRLNEERRCP